MFRLLVLASACLLAVAQSPELNIWRNDLRSPENKAVIEKLIHQQLLEQQLQQQQPQQQQQQQQQPQQQQQQQQQQQPQQQQSAPVSLTPPRFSSSGDDYVVDVATSNAIARSVLHFAQNLGNQLAASYRKTEIFSPLSIVSALALLFLGSKGRSNQELASVFGISDAITMHEQFSLMLRDVQQPTKETIPPQRLLDPWRQQSNNGNQRPNRRSQRPGAHEVYLANGLFTQLGYTLNPDYRQVVTDIYKSELQTVDFERSPASARFDINSWVEDNTNGKIKEIVNSHIEPSTRIIMANALYFKAFWETDFIESATTLDNFYPNGEGTQPVLRVPMMATGGNFPYHEDMEMGCKILGLPYRGNLSTMYIIQPLQSSVEQLIYMQQKLTADKVEDMISKMYKRSALVAMPKLHLVQTFNLKSTLQKIGLGGIFNIDQNDFSLIASKQQRNSQSSAPRARQSLGNSVDSLRNLEAQRKSSPSFSVGSDLAVSDIVHKVDFTVNEQGTEAAAATVTYLKKSGPDILFRVDTPFMLLIRHDPTKLILFYGLINEPSTAT